MHICSLPSHRNFMPQLNIHSYSWSSGLLFPSSVLFTKKQWAPHLWRLFGEAHSLSLWYVIMSVSIPGQQDKHTENPGMLTGVFIRKKGNVVSAVHWECPQVFTFFLTIKNLTFHSRVLAFWLHWLMLAGTRHIYSLNFCSLLWCL